MIYLFCWQNLYFHCFLCLCLKIAPNSCFWLPCWILASGSVFMQGKSTIKCLIPILCQWLAWDLIKWYNDLENGPHDELNNHTLTFLINYDLAMTFQTLGHDKINWSWPCCPFLDHDYDLNAYISKCHCYYLAKMLISKETSLNTAITQK